MNIIKPANPMINASYPELNFNSERVNRFYNYVGKINGCPPTQSGSTRAVRTEDGQVCKRVLNSDTNPSLDLMSIYETETSGGRRNEKLVVADEGYSKTVTFKIIMSRNVKTFA